jgi:uroporphyrinogen-III synthase
MRLLVTRPEPGASRTRAELVARGHEALIDPLMIIRPVAATPPADRFDAVALTSVNGARAAAELPWVFYSGLPVFTVGRRTRETALKAGFTDVTSADGDVDGLTDMLAKCLIPGERVLWLAGEDRAGDLAAALKPHGIAVETVVAYRAEPAEHLAETTVAALSAGRIDGILHYSRRSCETLLEAGRRDGVYEAVVRLTHYALSPRVAAPLAAAGAEVRIAATPDEAGLLDLLPSAGATDVRDGRTAMASKEKDREPHKSGQTPTEPIAEPTAATEGAGTPEAAAPGEASRPVEAEGEVPAVAQAEGEAPAAAAEQVPAEPVPSEGTPAEPAPGEAEAAKATEPETAASETAPSETAAPETATPEMASAAPPPPPAPQPARRGSGAVAGAIAGILAGAAVTLTASYLPIFPPRPADPGPLLEAQARLQAAESRISALESRPEPAPQSDPKLDAKYNEVEALGRRLSDLEHATQSLARLNARLEALEAAPRGEGAPAAPQPAVEDIRVPALQDKVAGLDGRVETATRGADEAVKLANAAGEAAQRAVNVTAALPDRIVTLEKKIADLSSLPGRLTALDQRIQLASQPSRAIAWPVALGALRTAIDEGKPYRAELDAAVALSGPGYEKLRAIDATADKGLPTLRAVQAKFEQTSSELLATLPRSEDQGSILERFARNAEGLVRFKPTQPAPGNSTGAVVARADDQLGRGDLAGAIATVGELPPDRVKIATPWLQLAKARLDADRLLSELTAEALAALARTGG